jgi:hypothetical protein
MLETEFKNKSRVYKVRTFRTTQLFTTDLLNAICPNKSGDSKDEANAIESRQIDDVWRFSFCLVA